VAEFLVDRIEDRHKATRLFPIACIEEKACAVPGWDQVISLKTARAPRLAAFIRSSVSADESGRWIVLALHAHFCNNARLSLNGVSACALTRQVSSLASCVMTKGKSFRSAWTGRYVSRGYGRSHQRTTLHETKGGGSSKGRYRSAMTGRYVTTKHGRSSPGTTIRDF
jgi:hypothetical protein